MSLFFTFHWDVFEESKRLIKEETNARLEGGFLPGLKEMKFLSFRELKRIFVSGRQAPPRFQAKESIGIRRSPHRDIRGRGMEFDGHAFSRVKNDGETFVDENDRVLIQHEFFFGIQEKLTGKREGLIERMCHAIP